ncbi:hypothetical protein [Beijerinckia sp. L45]|uniref:hypothetical protein n=1 Tax=Beijerinckia sp. L45 TaxID=1641855 RepID=UPI00131E03C4|nr:hypothetical protein [Beijerinckia sp. L45]
MIRPYTPLIVDNIGDISDLLDWMMLESPALIDRTGYFPGKTLNTVFYSLNESLAQVRGNLGDQSYLQLLDMSHHMRAHFEADPHNKTDDTLKGRGLINEMLAVLKQAALKR